jgi:hypothetical protein
MPDVALVELPPKKSRAGCQTLPVVRGSVSLTVLIEQQYIAAIEIDSVGGAES